jgi:hypothetical protein
MSKKVEFEIRNIQRDLAGMTVGIPDIPYKYRLQNGVNFIQRKLQNAPSFPPNHPVKFNHEKDLKLNSKYDFFAEINEETTKAKSEFLKLAKESSNAPIGVYSFEDCYVFGVPGLILDVRNNICWIGGSIGWSKGSIDTFICNRGLGGKANDNTLLIEDSLLSNIDKAIFSGKDKNCVLLSLPGFSNYGHWLIDVLPRLHHIACSQREDISVCSSRIERWGKEIAKHFGINELNVSTLEPMGGYRWDKIDVATTIHSFYSLDNALAKKYWDLLKHSLLQDQKGARTLRRRIYVSRSRFKKGRTFNNALAIESYFLQAGWDVLHPELLTLSEQAQIFSEASVIVGDDGSGLHNSIFSPPDTKVLCLNFDRINLFHASVAQVMGHALSYLDSDLDNHTEGDDGYSISLSRLNEAIALM